MLIVRVHVALRSVRSQGGSHRYRGHVNNVKQDVQYFAVQFCALAGVSSLPGASAPDGSKTARFYSWKSGLRSRTDQSSHNPYSKGSAIHDEFLDEVPDDEDRQCITNRLCIVDEPNSPSGGDDDNDIINDEAGSWLAAPTTTPPMTTTAPLVAVAAV